jgi:hypothetical protein
MDQHRTVEDIVDELEPKKNDEVSTCAPPSDESIHETFPLAQQQDDKVIFSPFQDFHDTLFHDSESEGEVESSDEVDLPCCTIEDEGEILEDKIMMHVECWKIGYCH